MKQYGCIGKKLTHSFSKEIHAKLADYEYNLIELQEEELPKFFEKRDFEAINVTIPYKETVLPYLDEISDIARRIGAVNTIVNRDGKLYGYNTDYFGMKALISRMGLDFHGKKVLILGTGGTSKTAKNVAKNLGASKILVVSRSGHQKGDDIIGYDEAKTLHADADIIMNTTPSGMYPDCTSRPIDITPFSRLQGVVDAIYNPLCSNLVLDARERGIVAEGGLYMLVMQAVFAVEKFLNISIAKEKADRVFASIYASKENIVLTGMPGSGKSTIGKLLHIDGYDFVDTDHIICEKCGCSIKDLITEKGEPYFRSLEAEVIREVSSEGGKIISTGGGAVLFQEDIRALKQNGRIFFIDADVSRLHAEKDRPLSDTEEKLKQIYHDRIPLYHQTADVIVPDLGSAEAEAEYIINKRKEFIQ